MNDNQPISLTPPQAPELEKPVSIDDGNVSPILPESSVKSRARKAFDGLGDLLGKNYDDIKNEIASGGELNLRAQAAATLDAHNSNARQRMVQDLASKTGAPISKEEVDQILSPTAPHNQPVDPTSVIERSYGHNVVYNTLENARRSMGDTMLDQAERDAPNSTEAAKQAGSTSAAKRAYAQTWAENIDAAQQTQSWGSYLGDQAKSILSFGIYDEAKLRGWMENVSPIAGVGLGNNLYEQTRSLLSLPFDQYKAKLDTILTSLKNDSPGLAAQYVRAVLGMSSSDTALSNLSTAVNAATLPGIGLAGKAVLGTVDAINTARIATRAAVEASAEPLATKATLLKGVGDTKGAAAETIANNITEDLSGTADPIQRSKDALLSGFKSDIEGQKPGTAPGLGQDLVNRINESANTIANNLYDTITRVAKVNRIPEVTASKEAVTQLMEKIREDYRGPNSSVGDINFRYDPLNNNHWFDVQLIREDGTLHTSVSQAEAWARLNGIVTKAPDGYLEQLSAKIDALREEIFPQLNEELKAQSQIAMDEDTLGLNRHFSLEGQLADAEAEYQRFQKTGGEGFAIKQKGLGFYIERTIPLKEDDPLVRSFIATTEASRTPFNWVNGMIGWLRTPRETLSKVEQIQREIATHGPSVLLGDAKDALGKSLRIPKKYEEDWSRAIDFSRTAVDPATGEKGYFFRTVQDVEDHWQRFYHRSPTEGEVQAYFAFKNGVETDRVYRTLRLFSLKSRVGTEQHQVSIFNKDGEKVSSGFFEGVTHNSLPGGHDGILILGKNAGSESYKWADALPKNLHKQLTDDIAQGKLKVVEVYAPAHRPLSGFVDAAGENRVRYVITPNLETKPLSYENQVPRRGGGHFDYDYDFYIKQAQIRAERSGKTLRHWYEGDTTVMPIGLRQMGKDVIEHLNAVREHLLQGNDAEAEAYNKAHLPIDWAEHKSWYESSVGPDGKRRAPFLDLNQPFHLVERNKSIIDMDKSLENRFLDTNGKTTLHDGTRQGSLDRQSAVRYTGQRDARDVYTITDTGKGTPQKPLYAYEPAKMVDPIPTMNRSLTGIINSTFMDDQKIFQVEHWLKEAQDYLRPTVQELQHSPFFHFNNPEWKPGTPPQIKNILESNRQKMLAFTGTPSKMDTLLHSVASDLADSIYTAKGQNALKISPTWMLPKLRDPFGFIRSAVYDLKLGLFNVPTFFVQAMTFTNIMGMAGVKNSSKGLMGTLLHQWSRVNSSPEILAHMDGLAQKMGWRPGEWLEARQALLDNGFFNVGREHAMLDNIGSNKVITNGKDQLLDFGRTFFREGASNTRGASWYTAYKEFRDLHPTGRLTRDDMGAILSRAADFDHNMSRAANSTVHTGIMSIPGQFYAYHLRLLELMTGTRLTAYEKARLFGVNALMYGLPVSAGLLDTPGVNMPWSAENIKSAASNAGYIPGDNFITTTIMQGIPAAMLGVVTGGGDIRKGNIYNIGDRWGPGNFDNINASLNGDKTVLDLIGGAAYSTVANALTETSNFRKMVKAFVTGNQQAFPAKPEDFLDIFKEISSVSNFQKAIIAANTGRWMSKTGNYMAPTSPLNGVLMAISGLQEQRVVDVNNIEENLKAQKQNYDLGLKNFVRQYQLGVRAMTNNDPEQGKQYFTRAYTWLEATGYPLEKRGSAVVTAGTGMEDLVSRMDLAYFFRDVPPDQIENRAAILKAKLNLQDERTTP